MRACVCVCVLLEVGFTVHVRVVAKTCPVMSHLGVSDSIDSAIYHDNKLLSISRYFLNDYRNSY